MENNQRQSATQPSSEQLFFAEKITQKLCKGKLGCEADWDDAKSVAALACVEAVQSYDTSRGAQLNTHIYSRVQGAVRHWLRGHRLQRIREGRPFATGIHEPLDYREPTSLSAQANDAAAALEGHRVGREETLAVLGWLDGAEREALTVHLTEGIGSYKVAERMGLKQGKVAWYIKHATDTIKRKALSPALMRTLSLSAQAQ